MTRREDVPVDHRMHGQRYKTQEQSQRLPTLNKELELGAGVINAWASAHYGIKLPFELVPVTCC
jgi:hypothetical protein